jgi:hypothetical protein
MRTSQGTIARRCVTAVWEFVNSHTSGLVESFTPQKETRHRTAEDESFVRRNVGGRRHKNEYQLPPAVIARLLMMMGRTSLSDRNGRRSGAATEPGTTAARRQAKRPPQRRMARHFIKPRICIRLGKITAWFARHRTEEKKRSTVASSGQHPVLSEPSPQRSMPHIPLGLPSRQLVFWK